MDGGVEPRQTRTQLAGGDVRGAGLSALWARFPGICSGTALPRTWGAVAPAHSLNVLPPRGLCPDPENLLTPPVFTTRKKWSFPGSVRVHSGPSRSL